MVNRRPGAAAVWLVKVVIVSGGLGCNKLASELLAAVSAGDRDLCAYNSAATAAAGNKAHLTKRPRLLLLATGRLEYQTALRVPYPTAGCEY